MFLISLKVFCFEYGEKVIVILIVVFFIYLYWYRELIDFFVENGSLGLLVMIKIG